MKLEVLEHTEGGGIWRNPNRVSGFLRSCPSVEFLVLTNISSFYKIFKLSLTWRRNRGK